MAGLAFTCLEQSNLNPNQRDRISQAISTVQQKILKAQTSEGHFGNVYSTPLALQVGKRAWGQSPIWYSVGSGLVRDWETWLLSAS